MSEAPWIRSKVWHEADLVVPGRRLRSTLPPRLARLRPTELTLPPTGQTLVRARFDDPVAIGDLSFSELVLEAQVPWTNFDRGSFDSHAYWVSGGTLAKPGPVRLPWRLGRALAAAEPLGLTMWGAANAFTPARDFAWRGLPFAAGHPVWLDYDRGVLAEPLALGGVELGPGTAVERDPDEAGLLEARLAAPTEVFGHSIPAGAVLVVRRHPAPHPVILVTSSERSTIQPDGTRAPA